MLIPDQWKVIDKHSFGEKQKTETVKGHLTVPRGIM